jgi:hypothetical protein
VELLSTTCHRFMDSGWPVLNVWLAEAKKNQDVTVLVEVLQVLQKLPVSVAALKQGNMGKLIKQLSKQEHPEVKNLASDLLSKWMAIFKDGQTGICYTLHCFISCLLRHIIM